MMGDEVSGSDPGTLNQDRARGEANTRDDQPSEAATAGDRVGPRVVSPWDREQAATQLAASLTEAIAEHLLYAERRVLNQADKIRASMLDDLERQRASVESLIGLFAERLRQQEEGLSTLRETIAQVQNRFDRHAEAIRSVGETQARHQALLSQILEVLRRLGATIESPPAAPTYL